MPVFCSSRLESSKDHTDNEGDTVDHIFNQIIDKKDVALEYFRVNIYCTIAHCTYCTNGSLQVFRTMDIEEFSSIL